MSETQQSVSYASPNEEKARSIVSRNVLWAAGVGLFPIPIVDFVGLTAVQLKMVHELAEVYGRSFRSDVGKAIIAGLVASLGAPSLAVGTAGAILRSIPFIGPTLGFFALPGFSAGFTYAIGRVFIQHFETGGTMLDFDVTGMREYFIQYYREFQDGSNGQQPADASA